MLLTIHQPEHLPWLGFFDKMALAEKYVILDTVQFTKAGVQKRNKLLTPKGDADWLGVPVHLSGHTSGTIGDLGIDNGHPWRKKYLARIRETYRHHPKFAEIFPLLEEVVERPHELLVELNIDLIELFRRVLDIKTPIVRASTLGQIEGKKSDLNLDICKKLGAATYLSGPSGKDYLDLASFEAAGIRVDFHKFTHPQYPQHGRSDFVPYLSTLDLLMNQGSEARVLFVKTLSSGQTATRSPESLLIP